TCSSLSRSSSPSPSSSTFSLSRPPAHRPLHSFPTRRSSDLAGPLHGHAPGVLLVGLHPGRPRRLRRAARWRESPTRRLGLPPDRSEEHTSELQSRGHLVCRLLLEKKKKKTVATTNLRHTKHT